MKGIMARILAAFGVILITLLGCQSMSDVTPGSGRKATITGHSYDEIWTAALKVADGHFEIREQDQAKGIITAERTMTAWGQVRGSEFTLFHLRPARTLASRGGRRKCFEVLRDLQDVLDGKPMR